jgi:hypothetical protein
MEMNSPGEQHGLQRQLETTTISTKLMHFLMNMDCVMVIILIGITRLQAQRF